MLSVILCGLLLCTGIMIITQGRDILTGVRITDLNVRMFFYLCLVGMVNNICYAVLMIMERSLLYDVIEAFAWCTGIAFMGITVYLLAFLLDTDKQKTYIYTSVILYMGIIFYIVDIFLRGGLQYVDIWGKSENYEPIFVGVFMTCLCLLYIYFIVSMVYSYRNRRSRKRERIIFQLIMVLCIVTFISGVTETIMSFAGTLVIPLRSLSMVVTAWCLKRSYQCHSALEIRREDYEEVFEANSHEPVVICNDEGTVVFINKCASIAIVEEKKTVIGRQLIDVFEFKGYDVKNLFAPHIGVFSVTAIYKTTGRRCNLTVQNVFDAYGEIFTNIVTIYRLDYINPVASKDPVIANETQSGMSDAVAVTDGAKILLVDDSPSTLTLLENVMRPYMMNIEKAYSGEETLQCLRDGKRYDMIFIDHMMPDMDGVETTKQIRAMEGDYFNKVPIVFCTSTNIEDNLSEFLKVRFNDFLSKPVSVKQLSDILARWLWRRVTEMDEPVKESEEEIPRIVTNFGIEGIDEKLASKYIGDNEEMYITLLRNFLGDMREMIIDLEECYSHYDRMRFRIFTHAMSSACKGIGALEFSQRATELEQACLSEDNQYIAANIAEYLMDFNNLMNRIEVKIKTSAD